jgi:GNAT superfamily N-acetyltransferase
LPRRLLRAAPELDAARVAAALAHSTVVAAAYVSDAGGAAAPASGAAPASATPAPPPPPPGAGGLGWLIPKPPARRLVGFARAASDRTLVALVTDVAVAPAHRRAGVGSRLLFALLDELRSLGIGDVGLLAADAQRPFFRRV